MWRKASFEKYIWKAEAISYNFLSQTLKIEQSVFKKQLHKKFKSIQNSFSECHQIIQCFCFKKYFQIVKKQNENINIYSKVIFNMWTLHFIKKYLFLKFDSVFEKDFLNVWNVKCFSSFPEFFFKSYLWNQTLLQHAQWLKRCIF